MTTLGERLTDDELDKTMWMRDSDLDEDGEVSYKEIVFKVFDKNGNGFISAEEFRHLMKINLSKELTVPDVDEFFREVDSDGNNQVDYEEFDTMMT